MFYEYTILRKLFIHGDMVTETWVDKLGQVIVADKRVPTQNRGLKTSKNRLNNSQKVEFQVTLSSVAMCVLF